VVTRRFDFVHDLPMGEGEARSAAVERDVDHRLSVYSAVRRLVANVADQQVQTSS